MNMFTKEQLDELLEQAFDDSLPWQYFTRQTVRFLVEDLIAARDELLLWKALEYD
jgi:hypothetical protein